MVGGSDLVKQREQLGTLRLRVGCCAYSVLEGERNLSTRDVVGTLANALRPALLSLLPSCGSF